MKATLLKHPPAMSGPAPGHGESPVMSSTQQVQTQAYDFGSVVRVSSTPVDDFGLLVDSGWRHAREAMHASAADRIRGCSTAIALDCAPGAER